MTDADRPERDGSSNPGGHACPLCAADDPGLYFRDRRRRYLHCPRCELIFVPQPEHLSLAQERERYDQHRNDPGDPAYREFLAALYRPLRQRLSPGAAGLDYGSGPGPTLSVMFEEAGFPMSIYDPYYAPDRSVLSIRYDFITCSETVEHFARPGQEWEGLVRLLKPQGWLGVMTRLFEPGIDFAQWHYKQDPTHVCFYSNATIDWISRRFGLRKRLVTSSVILLQHP